jgi:hypothetical protein
MATVVSLQSVQTALSTNAEVGIEFESLVARAQKIDQHLRDNSPHILNLSIKDRIEVRAILEKTIEELYQHSHWIDLCLFAQVSPEMAVDVMAQGIAGGPNLVVGVFAETFGKRLAAAECVFAGFNAATIEQQQLINTLEQDWIGNVEAQKKSNLLYTGIVNQCIGHLESVDEQVKNSLSMENKVCWIL